MNTYYYKAKRYPGATWMVKWPLHNWTVKPTYQAAAKLAKLRGLDDVWLDVGGSRFSLDANDTHPHTITVPEAFQHARWCP